MKITVRFFISLLALLAGWVLFDVVGHRQIPQTAAKDAVSQTLKRVADDVMIALEEGETPDYEKLPETLQFMRSRYDTADFQLPSFIRILYHHADKLPADVFQNIKHTLLGFKYWMDQPGDDSMCYWSENHQILFASGEYLIGHYFSSDVFTNTTLRGEDHKAMGRQRVLAWLEQRFLYGFTEWYSSTYYVEDIAPLAVLIDFAPDEDIRIKAKMVMDLLIFDLATQNFQGTFATQSGRMYERAKMSGQFSSIKESMALIWPKFNRQLQVTDVRGMEANFKYLKNYQVPPVLTAIGYDQQDTAVIQTSNGLNLSELANAHLLGQQDEQIMMQFASEAFSNPEVIQNTLAYVDRNRMFSNEFLADLRLINIGLLKTLGLTPTIMRWLNSAYDGTAIQRANSYTYRTPHYLMSTAQAYHPGSYGDQHSLFSLTLNNQLNIFTQHPAKSLSDSGALGSSPNYWVGNGYQPHTVQDKNINLTLWQLPDHEPRLAKLLGMSRPITPYTHAYFPQQFMTRSEVIDNMAFAQVGEVFVALIARNKLYFKPLANNKTERQIGLDQPYDLIQEGRDTFWITEVATTADYPTFAQFKQAIQAAAPTYHEQKLSYKHLELNYQGEFKVAGVVQNTEYPRFHSKYAQTPRNAPIIRIEHEGQQLILDFYHQTRTIQ